MYNNISHFYDDFQDCSIFAQMENFKLVCAFLIAIANPFMEVSNSKKYYDYYDYYSFTINGSCRRCNDTYYLKYYLLQYLLQMKAINRCKLQ